MSSEPVTPAALTPLDAANRIFTEAYERTREQAQEAGPVLVLLAAEVVLRRGAERRAFPVMRASFSAAKGGAHIAVALFALSIHSGRLDAERMERVETLRGHAQNALKQLDDPALSVVSGELESVLQLALRFVTKVAAKQEVSVEDRAAFASAAGPRILELTALATREQIAELHHAVEAAVALLSNDERTRLEVVVVGDHQARVRSLGMQYFQRRLGEAPGQDERVTFGEHIVDEEEALALVGTRRLDRAIAAAFFGDAKRLQRDVLGDAAKACLEKLDLPPL